MIKKIKISKNMDLCQKKTTKNNCALSHYFNLIPNVGISLNDVESRFFYKNDNTFVMGLCLILNKSLSSGTNLEMISNSSNSGQEDQIRRSLRYF